MWIHPRRTLLICYSTHSNLSLDSSARHYRPPHQMSHIKSLSIENPQSTPLTRFHSRHRIVHLPAISLSGLLCPAVVHQFECHYTFAIFGSGLPCTRMPAGNLVGGSNNWAALALRHPAKTFLLRYNIQNIHRRARKVSCRRTRNNLRMPIVQTNQFEHDRRTIYCPIIHPLQILACTCRIATPPRSLGKPDALPANPHSHKCLFSTSRVLRSPTG